MALPLPAPLDVDVPDMPPPVIPDAAEPLETIVPLDEAEPLDTPETPDPLDTSVPLEATDPLDTAPLLASSAPMAASEGADASLGPFPLPWIETFAQ